MLAGGKTEEVKGAHTSCEKKGRIVTDSIFSRLRKNALEVTAGEDLVARQGGGKAVMGSAKKKKKRKRVEEGSPEAWQL